MAEWGLDHQRAPVPTVDFDYPDEPTGLPIQMESHALNAVLDWLYPAQAGKHKNTPPRPSRPLLRAYVLLWYLRPEWLRNADQKDLAAHLGVSRNAVWRVTRQFRDHFGVPITRTITRKMEKKGKVRQILSETAGTSQERRALKRR